MRSACQKSDSHPTKPVGHHRVAMAITTANRSLILANLFLWCRTNGMNANVCYHTITCDTKKQVKTDFRANNNESHSSYVHVCACMWPFVRVHTQMHRTVTTAHTMTAFYSIHMPARRTAESGPHECRPRIQDYNWAQKKNKSRDRHSIDLPQ